MTVSSPAANGNAANGTATDGSSFPPFETVFAVPMTCESCIASVNTTLHGLPGISKVKADLSTQLVSITGTAAPSAIVTALQGSGRDAILRGTSKADSAAVCILETHAQQPLGQSAVRGLVRIVQVAPKMTVFDVTLRSAAENKATKLSEGLYSATIRETGDISEGPATTGRVFDPPVASAATEASNGSLEKDSKRSGVLGVLRINSSGAGSAFWDRPIDVWSIIGRSIVVAPLAIQPSEAADALDVAKTKESNDALVGVIARSAGAWDNDKTVCSCSGKTVWEEREEQRARNML